MKLNATAEMMPVTWPEFGKIHPLPQSQTRGYQVFEQLEKGWLRLQALQEFLSSPMLAQGEYTGLLVIRKYHEHREGHRNICLIPQSAHGTNPASAVMCGMKVVAIACDAKGNVDLDDLKAKAEA